MDLIVPKETQIIAACKDALTAQNDYALKALIAGQLLLEHREALKSSSHSEKNLVWQGKKKPDGDKFSVWITVQVPGVSQAKAYRWMKAAERVARLQMGWSTTHHFQPVIDVGGGETVAMSVALTAPEKQLPEAALKFRQDVFDFMADHTLGEAATAALDGESDAKRITLAAGGKSKGGKGGDRKDFPMFMGKNLVNFTGNLKGWEKWRTKQPAQYAAVCATLEKFVLTGGRVQIHANGNTQEVAAWPLSFCELLADLLKKRLKKDRQ